MDEIEDGPYCKTVQVMSPDWDMATIPVQMVADFLSDRAPAVNPATWWQRAYELSHEEQERLEELIDALVTAGANKDEAVITSRAAYMAARSERFINAGDFLSSTASAQAACLFAGFLMGMGGHTPEKIEQMLAGMKSEQARSAAHARHKENRALRADVEAHWQEFGHTYKSKDAAAAAIAGKIVPLSFATVREYLKGL